MSDDGAEEEVRVYGDWEEHYDHDTQAYYFVNAASAETTWDRPDGFPEPEDFGEAGGGGKADDGYQEGDSGDGDYIDAESEEEGQEGEGEVRMGKKQNSIATILRRRRGKQQQLRSPREWHLHLYILY